jgi:hypothetical protein
MSNERKKIEFKPIIDLKPKTRVVETNEVIKKIEVKPSVSKKVPEPPKDYKVIRIAMNANSEEFKAIGEKVQKGEAKFAYYGIDGDKSYCYYHVIKK